MRHQAASAARSHSSQASSRFAGRLPASQVQSNGASCCCGPMGSTVGKALGRQRAKTLCLQVVALSVSRTGQWGIVGDSSITWTSTPKRLLTSATVSSCELWPTLLRLIYGCSDSSSCSCTRSGWDLLCAGADHAIATKHSTWPTRTCDAR